jgi:hypothetical protein
MAGEEGEASAARKLSTATSILARTCRQRNRTPASDDNRKARMKKEDVSGERR